MKKNVKQYLLLDDVMDLVTAEDKIIVRRNLVPRLLALNKVRMYGRYPDKISPIPPEEISYVIDFDYNLPKAILEKVIQDLIVCTPEADEDIDEEESILDEVIQDLMEGTAGSWPEEADVEIAEQSSSEGSILDEVIQDLTGSMPGSWSQYGSGDVDEESGLEGLTREETETIRASIHHIPRVLDEGDMRGLKGLVD